jgi:hypothetical protein
MSCPSLFRKFCPGRRSSRAAFVMCFLLGACFPNPTKRAGVGPEVKPQPNSTRAPESLASPDASTRPLQPKVESEKAKHPFQGVAYAAYDLGKSEEISQSDLKISKPYFRVFFNSERQAHFVYPRVRGENTFIRICDEESAEKHPLFEVLHENLCRPTQAESWPLSKETAVSLALEMNNQLKFRSGPFYFESPEKKWRVFPDALPWDAKTVCEKSQKNSGLSPWCERFLKDYTSAQKAAYRFFASEEEAKSMAEALTLEFGIKQSQ